MGKCTENKIDSINIENEMKNLKKGFVSFYDFSLSLIESLDENNGHLRFAVVNMQIALELFLKYYFLATGQVRNVLYIDKGKIKYHDFFYIMDKFYKTHNSKQHISKKKLIKISELRNSIVHKGRFSDWDDEVVNYIINCAFFIQDLYSKNFQESLLSTEYSPHKLHENHYWRVGAEEYAQKLAEEAKTFVMECPDCYSRALIDKKLFDFEDNSYFEEGLQCLSCLCGIDTEQVGTLIECCQCKKKAYFVEQLNIQSDQTHLSMCFNCGNRMNVRTCRNCNKIYFPDLEPNESSYDNIYFCSEECKEYYIKDHKKEIL